MAADVARRRRAWTITAVALLLGGAAAVGVGFATQTPSPPGPKPVAAAELNTEAAAPVPAPSTRPTHAAKPKPVAKPTSVSIPSVGISSTLLTMGLAKDGTIAVAAPGKDFNKAGWFKGSPRPGQDGPAVIEGHVDSVYGKSVFYRLGAVKKGAEVRVGRADGSRVTFVVDRVASYPKADFPVATVYGNTAGPELRLITCGGAVDHKTGHYVDNTVVYAHEA
jgi:sortase (surface protein transpeptidase)